MRDFHLPGRSAVFATNGMAATSHPLGALIAVETLKAGGNAMDAAIAGAFVLQMCEPQMTGIGGDCFVLFQRPGDAAPRAMNGSGRAPAALKAEDLRAAGHDRMPAGGPLPVTLPGAVDAFCRLSEDWGRLGIDRLLAPAIHYAEAGVPVSPRTAFDWTAGEAFLTGAAREFYLLNGAAPSPGMLYRHPALGEAFQHIARTGRAGFYEGPVAEDMVAALRAAGGCHTEADFAAVAAEYTDPLKVAYGGATLHEHPPNGQGATAILLLKILSKFDLAAMDPFGAERAHIEAEAVKLAYSARNRFIADPDHATRTDHMTAPETAERLAALIRPDRAMQDPHRLSEEVHRDTIYITVVDRDRMAVSLIYSIFRKFGAGLASDRFGILFHNRGSGFTLAEGHPNEAMGGKRPLHTIIPGMLSGSDFTMPFGVMGGAYQAAGHGRFVTNLMDYGLHPQAAIDAPRCFAYEGRLAVERGYPDAVRAALADLGHDVFIPDEPIGGAQAIRIDTGTGVLQGGSDPRKDGCALGY
ncbi:gamma-glutamyltransferase family protein [Ovoidimarina sediminis]|uniref:gamma-glutamyltransferase family protein n=1 Tax=Ovoidimarina sediminis TaxID=3079856 RepID=UPI0029083279|nr:gamma-glutamyltransferase family protein [Rhodophyticola sp. MJ-SS7]MDU8943805.1 gamma-glutamyltransferase family protein [Rhodophyticola sp. MJ-SS7]